MRRLCSACSDATADELHHNGDGNFRQRVAVDRAYADRALKESCNSLAGSWVFMNGRTRN